MKETLLEPGIYTLDEYYVVDYDLEFVYPHDNNLYIDLFNQAILLSARGKMGGNDGIHKIHK